MREYVKTRKLEGEWHQLMSPAWDMLTEGDKKTFKKYCSVWLGSLNLGKVWVPAILIISNNGSLAGFISWDARRYHSWSFSANDNQQEAARE